MPSPLDEFDARISDLKADLDFVALAAQLRPRIGGAVNWQAAGEVRELVTRFMEARSSRPEGVFGPLLVRLLGAFERYMRKLIIHAVDQRAAGVKSYEDLPLPLTRRNLVLTGRVLTSIDTPREHLTIDVETLIENLASCKRGSSSFRLNSVAFSTTVTGASSIVIQRALESVDVTGWWDEVGGNTALAKILTTKGARATGDRARERLNELWRWRNHLAHGGDEEIALSEVQLREAIDFVTCFSHALDDVVQKELRK